MAPKKVLSGIGVPSYRRTFRTTVFARLSDPSKLSDSHVLAPAICVPDTAPGWSGTCEYERRVGRSEESWPTLLPNSLTPPSFYIKATK